MRISAFYIKLAYGTITVLEGYSDQEKGAYLGAVASIATADRQTSDEELQYIDALCDAADISETQKEAVIRASSACLMTAGCV
jgi:hypothetical protein